MNFDAYTIRKMAPRLLVAVVAVNVSIYLCLAAVDFTNVLGKGIGQLLLAPFEDTKVLDINIGGGVAGNGALIGSGFLAAILPFIYALATGSTVTGAAIAGTAIIGTAATGIGIAILVLLLLIAVFVICLAMAVVFTLIIRQGLLMFLIITSPVAIALFVLPGTEKYFKQWLKLFLAMLMLYPIIAIIFAMSDIMGALLLGSK